MSLLSVQNVGKSFRSYHSEWQRFAGWLGVSMKPSAEHWVLRDISFSIKAGESIGIIGQNGAGKSTLLKIITGTLQPSEGQIQVNGRIAAILELGMGFNPDLTGRENAYHGLGLMGYSHADIEKVMPELEAFAEVGEYFDQPIRVYSSGMQMRVAFAVVTAFRPELLIVDEALSVGDSYFQHKSFNRIREFNGLGTTLLFVSHGMGDVRTLCDRVLLLNDGRILKEGLPDEVIDFYSALTAERENARLPVKQKRKENGWLHTKYGTKQAVVESIRLLDAETESSITTAFVGQNIIIETKVLTNEALPRIILGNRIMDRFGHLIWGTNTWHTKQVLEDVSSGSRIVFKVSFRCTLGPGSYSLSFGLVSSDTHLENCYHKEDNPFIFDVINKDKTIFVGSNWFDEHIDIHLEKADI